MLGDKDMSKLPRISFSDLRDGMQVRDTLKLSNKQMEKVVRDHIRDMKPREIQNYCEKFFETNNRVKE